MNRFLNTILCGAVLTGLLCTGAQAAKTDVSVMLNGEMLSFSDAAPQIVNSRTYLPFRAVFTALGFADEDITFRPETRMVRAEKGDMIISMVIGENQIKVVEGDDRRIIETDVPAFIDPVLSRTYVPARFVSEAAGYRVGWDDLDRIVIIDDVEALLEQNTESYTMVEKWRAYEQSVRGERAVMTGSYEGMQYENGRRLALDGKFEMYTEQTGAYELNAEMNLGKGLGGGSFQPLLPESLSLEMRGDLDDRSCYFRSDNMRTEQEIGRKDVWFHSDLNDSANSMGGLIPTVRGNTRDMSGEDYISELLRNLTEQYPDVPAGTLLKNLNALLADSAFQTSDKLAKSVLNAPSLQASVAMKLKNDKVVGYIIHVDQSGLAGDGGLLNTVMDLSMQDAVVKNHQVVRHNGRPILDMTTKGSYQRANRSPAPVPGEGSVILEAPGT